MRHWNKKACPVKWFGYFRLFHVGKNSTGQTVWSWKADRHWPIQQLRASTARPDGHGFFIGKRFDTELGYFCSCHCRHCITVLFKYIWAWSRGSHVLLKSNSLNVATILQGNRCILPSILRQQEGCGCGWFLPCMSQATSVYIRPAVQGYFRADLLMRSHPWALLHWALAGW